MRVDEISDNQPPTALSNPPNVDVSKGGRETPWPSIRSPRSAIRPTQTHGVEHPGNQGDPFRPLNVYTHGPGAISQIIRNQAYYNGNPSTLIYYYYDALGNMLTYSYSSSGYGNFEMDAFGNRIPDSPTWPPIDSSGPKEHLTGKMYDEDTGLYYFHARWYDPEVGRFVSREKYAETFGASPYDFCLASPSVMHDPDGRRPRIGRTSGNCGKAYEATLAWIEKGVGTCICPEDWEKLGDWTVEAFKGSCETYIKKTHVDHQGTHWIEYGGDAQATRGSNKKTSG